MTGDHKLHPLDVLRDLNKKHNPGVRTNHVPKDKAASACPCVILTAEEDAELQLLLDNAEKKLRTRPQQ